MARSRYKPSNDPKIIERRQWYREMQKDFDIPGLFKEDGNEISSLKSSTPRDMAVVSDQKSYSGQSSAASVERLPETEAKWLRMLNRPRNASSTVICIPGIGHNPSYFSKMASIVQPLGVQMYAVCLPGRLNRVNEKHLRSLRHAVDCVVAEMKARDLLIPEMKSNALSIDDTYSVNTNSNETVNSSTHKLVIFGHCLGSFIAYELTRSMIHMKCRVSHLIVSSSLSPILQSEQNQDVTGHKYCFQPDRDIIERMIQLDGIPNALLTRRELLKKFTPLTRADYYMQEKYVLITYSNLRDIVLLDDDEDSDADENTEFDEVSALTGVSGRERIGNYALTTARRPVENKGNAKDNVSSIVCYGASSIASRRERNDAGRGKPKVPLEDREDIVPKPLKVSAPVTALFSQDNDLVSREDICSWEKVSNAGFEVIEFETGKHNFLLKDENISALLLLFEKVCGEE